MSAVITGKNYLVTIAKMDSYNEYETKHTHTLAHAIVGG